MLRSKSVIPKVKAGGALSPVLPLVPIKLAAVDDDKGMFVVFELKTRVGQPADSTKYKKYVRKFDEGTPQEWIDLLKDLDEIWTQNSMTGGTDRASTVRAVVKGESGVSFETALQEARSDEEGVVVNNITANHVTAALNAVTNSVFPHRALETQKLWMTRKMFKPADMTTRQTAAAINRLNNALPLFPNGSEASKFTPQELIGLLEWSLPPAWRAKFDLDGYVPSLHPKIKLIEACEAIERNEVTIDKSKSSDASANKKVKFDVSKVKNKADQKGSARKTASFYCTEHGKNSTHSTSDCRVLKYVGKNGTTDKDTKRVFSNKTFRKELHLLAKKSSKAKVLDLYTTAINRERAKLEKKKSAKRKARDDSDSDSGSDMSVNVISAPEARVKKIKTGKTTDKPVKTAVKSVDKTGDVIAEERQYQKRLAWLKDHGDKGKILLEGTDTEDSDNLFE